MCPYAAVRHVVSPGPDGNREVDRRSSEDSSGIAFSQRTRGHSPLPMNRILKAPTYPIVVQKNLFRSMEILARSPHRPLPLPCRVWEKEISGLAYLMKRPKAHS